MLHSLKRFFAGGALCALATAALAAPPSLPGRYDNQGRTSEFGATLLLEPDGRFELLRVYGDEDVHARGTWQVSGNELTLATSQGVEPRFRPLEEKDGQLARAEPGVWIVWLRYALMEVTFEARSGQTATAISGGNGDAIVKMPASEEWVRVGLRRKGVTADYQWFPISPAIAQLRIAGFLPKDTEWFGNRSFKTQVARIVGDDLVLSSRDPARPPHLYIKRAAD